MTHAIEAYAEAIGFSERRLPYRLAIRSDDFTAFAAGYEGKSFSRVLKIVGVTKDILEIHRGISNSTLVPMVEDLEAQYQLGRKIAGIH